MPAGLYRFSWLEDAHARNPELETNAAESEILFESDLRTDRREAHDCFGGTGARTNALPVAMLCPPRKRNSARRLARICQRTSPSSWMATGAGRSSGTSRESRGTGSESKAF